MLGLTALSKENIVNDCLICSNTADNCGCMTHHTLTRLDGMTSEALSALLRDCYEGPLVEEKRLRVTICSLLLQREALGITLSGRLVP